MQRSQYLFCFLLLVLFLGYGCNSGSGVKSDSVETDVLMGRQGSDPVYLSPLSLVSHPSGGKIYVGLSTAASVAVVDVETSRLERTISLPFQPKAVAISADGSQLFLADGQPQGHVYALSTVNDSLLWKVAVEHTPCYLDFDGVNQLLYVANRFSNSISVVDPQKRSCIARLPVIREPKSVKVSPDGSLLAVANHLPLQRGTDSYITTRVSLFRTGSWELITHAPVQNGAQLAEDLCFSPDGKYLYLTHIISQYAQPANKIDWGWINSNALSIYETADPQHPTTISLDEGTEGAANPCGISVSADGSKLLVALSGVHQLYVINREALHQELDSPEGAYLKKQESEGFGSLSGRFYLLPTISVRLPLAGRGPRYVVEAGGKAWVTTYFSGRLERVDLAAPFGSEAVVLGDEPPMNAVRRGELSFADASICYQGWQSCISCHPDGRADGVNWDQMNDGADNPKNTKSLLFSHVTPPSMITGIRADAPLAVRKGLAFSLFSNRTSEVAPDIDSFLMAMRPIASPYLVDGSLSEQALRGKGHFETLGCARCHSGTYYTDQKLHNVGSGRSEYENAAFDTPGLQELWRTAPYLYDGRALTLREAMVTENSEGRHGKVSDLTASEQEELIYYLLSI